MKRNYSFLLALSLTTSAIAQDEGTVFDTLGLTPAGTVGVGLSLMAAQRFTTDASSNLTVRHIAVDVARSLAFDPEPSILEPNELPRYSLVAHIVENRPYPSQEATGYPALVQSVGSLSVELTTRACHALFRRKECTK
jgi:hypothetical protein